MSNDSGYFVGPPVQAVERAAAQPQGVPKPGPPPAQAPRGERDPPPGTTDGYFVGQPLVKVKPEPPAAAPPQPAASARKNKPSFLAKWVPCLFGGGASSVE